MSKAKGPPDKVALYEKLVALHPDVERKGATWPYTSLNGHMFSFLAPDGSMGLRLGKADREAFLKKHKTKLCEQYGRVMKEYVVVPDSLLKKTGELSKYFGLGLDYVASLKPKPTTRKAKKKPAKKATAGKAGKKKTSAAKAKVTRKKPVKKR